ncbi:MAG: hypothetical protein KDH09_18375 [Chrysiogenetes bacterium]|nr:hypothetical protein [Chrysiogenetes bacterium]
MFDDILERLLRCPTAPFHEGYVLGEIRALARQYGLPLSEDRFGNLRVDHPAGGSGAQLLMVAHTDHPAFLVTGMRGKRATGAWWGGVLPPYFKGAKVKLHPYCAALKPEEAAAMAIRGRITSTKLDESKRRVHEVSVQLEAAPDKNFEWIGGWDLPEFRRRGNRIVSSHIDDLVGAALALSTLVALRGKKLKAPVAALFTRAEEDGFHGALAATMDKLVPANALALSIESSSQRAGARLGKGPVLRQGDAAGVFDSRATRWIEEQAAALAKKKNLVFQKRVMDGGACEATAFGALGYASCGLALPLAGYHNMGPKDRIVAEQVDADDAAAALALLEHLARNWTGELPVKTKLGATLEKRRKESVRQLKKRKVPTGF